MGRVLTVTNIQRTPDAVFAYVTTPGNWPAWHPSSQGVTGATAHPLEKGRQATEEFLVAGRRGRVVWTVTERVSPWRWVIDGQVGGGGRGTVAYTLTPEAGGTRFVREFSYRFANPLMAVLDWLVIRRRIAAESAEALRRLRHVLEGDKSAGSS